MQAPRLTRTLEKLLNPVLGKSVALYFEKPAQRATRPAATALTPTPDRAAA
jgi:hypothetical protein